MRIDEMDLYHGDLSLAFIGTRYPLKLARGERLLEFITKSAEFQASGFFRLSLHYGVRGYLIVTPHGSNHERANNLDVIPSITVIAVKMSPFQAYRYTAR